ncbi:hypothetical protein AGR3A_Cc190138 [Agrobacterium tomkonis CFBP 6623]|uniref:Uncharacterized protein n=1 Tax=Agrobacterium tomkonis CFBP 6623 TaxID=1183432 RepID=A0A1S7P2L7_9HYPH|nr:hypothetical protein AGR3A_Cc190138 [Agrobacterium tomkonis CFBP 6623]
MFGLDGCDHHDLEVEFCASGWIYACIQDCSSSFVRGRHHKFEIVDAKIPRSDAQA